MNCGNDILSCLLYSRISPLYRLYGLPFSLAYLIPGVWMWQYGVADREGGRYIIIGIFTVVAICHVAVLLACKWSISVLCSIAYRREESLSKATFIRVVPVPGHGEGDVITPLMNRMIPGTQIVGRKFPPAVAYFIYRGTSYLLEEDANTKSVTRGFCRLEFPIDSPIFRYSEAVAYGGKDGMDRLKVARKRWGKNEIVIHVPSFRDLFLEQATMPFFVFQVFCVGLWSLDEYWYYSLFSLLMLVLFEGLTAHQRQRNVLMMRDIKKPPHPVMVYRVGRWTSVPSECLVPGDLMSIISIPHVEVMFPCDALLLSGSCVINEAALTGESLPQMRRAVNDSMKDEILDITSDVHQNHRLNIVFSGVQVLQHDGSDDGPDDGVVKRLNILTPPPDGGCVGVALRTGLETVQGQLVRAIVHSGKQMNVNSNEEIGIFIGALVLVAIATSSFVLWHGLTDPRRDRYKLFLHCILIITSVVPPELPMELSMAVTNSLTALQRKYIYCTEPFRIPLAGKIDACCFDKTGTLTTDNLVLKGVASVPPNFLKNTNIQQQQEGQDNTNPKRSSLTKAKNLPVEVIRILAGCQSLMNIKGDIFGDPTEKATLYGINWQLLPHGLAASEASFGTTGTAEPSMSIKVLHSFPFNPDLRCMSNVIQIDPLRQNLVKKGSHDGKRGSVEAWLVSKGAPETLMDLLCDAPSDYESSYKRQMMKGRRVLAIAYRPFPSLKEAEKASHQPREQLERGLTFAGFLVLVNPLKPDAPRVIHSLQKSSHKTIIITGDSSLTAADIAKQVGIISCSLDDVLILASKNKLETDKGGDVSLHTLCWRPLLSYTVEMESEKVSTTATKSSAASSTYASTSAASSQPVGVVNVEIQQLKEFSKSHALCITGDGMASIGYDSILKNVVPHISIFARISPEQKEMIVSCLNRMGKTTLMVGDGTNDVGALKCAHIGISVVSSSTPSKRKNFHRGGKSHMSHHHHHTMGGDDGIIYEDPFSDPTVMKLGDASIASPFIARTPKLSSVLSVIRQGRCTLITTLQVYKILALNCITSAYSLSTLYLWGIRQGDRQMTILGVFVAMLFFFFIRTKPLIEAVVTHLCSHTDEGYSIKSKEISKERPHSRIFCWPLMSSIISQSVVHTASLIFLSSICSKHVSMDDPSMAPDADFTPNTFNSMVFLLTCTMQINCFTWNYPGKPFMHPLKDNSTLLWTLVFSFFSVFAAALEIFPPLNDLLELAPFTDEALKYKVIGIMMANTVLSYGVVQLTT